MTPTISPSDNPIAFRKPDRLARLAQLGLSFLSSLTLHAVLVFLIVLQIVRLVAAPPVVEIPVDVVTQEPVEQPLPPPPRPQPETIKQSARPTGVIPDVADEEKKSNAQQAARTRNGFGKDQQDEGSPRSADDPKVSDDALRLPNKEDARETLPNKSKEEANRKSRVAPPGVKRIQPTARRPDPASKDDQSAEKKKDGECGPAIAPPGGPGPSRPADVLGPVSLEQQAAMFQKLKAASKWEVAPRYRNSARAFVHLEGARPGSFVVVVVPPGMNVSRGDRVEVRRAYTDPSHPCMYIPNMIVRAI